MLSTRRHQQQQAYGCKDVSFRSITGTSFRTTSTGVSFRTTGMGASFRTTGTYRSARSFGTAKTAMTDGTDGSMVSTPTKKQPFKPPKMLAPITNDSDESPLSDKGKASLALDDGFDRVFAQVEDTTLKVTSVKNGSRHQKTTHHKQHKSQGRMLGRLFRRRASSSGPETNNMTLPAEQSQSFFDINELAEVPLDAVKCCTSRDSVTNIEKTSASKETPRDNSKLSGDTSSFSVQHSEKGQDKTPVTELRKSWVGLTLEIPKVNSRHSTNVHNTVNCNRGKFKNEVTGQSTQPRRGLARQPSCRSLFESFRRVQCNIPEQVRIEEEESVSSSSSSSSSGLRSLEGQASCTRPTSLQEAISTSSSILFMLNEAEKDRTANHVLNDGIVSSKALVHPPTFLQVRTSISSVSSSHLFEFTTICRDQPNATGFAPPTRLEIQSSVHSVDLISQNIDENHDGKLKVSVEDLPTPPFLYTVSSSSVQNFMQKIQESGKSDIQQESNAIPPPELKWRSSASSQQRYDWKSNEDARRINPTLSPMLKVQISTTLLNSGRDKDTPPTLPVRRESSEYTLEWASYQGYFENNHHATQCYNRGCDTPPFFPECTKPVELFCGGKTPKNEISLVGLPLPTHSFETACNQSVEIEPGHKVTVRGAEETMLYVAADATGLGSNTRSLIATFQCWTCSTTTHCVFDAAYVVCPICRTIQPTEYHQGWGAGLGFLTRDWDEWKRALSSQHA